MDRSYITTYQHSKIRKSIDYGINFFNGIIRTPQLKQIFYKCTIDFGNYFIFLTGDQ